MIKFEVIITAWEDGLHRGMRRVELEEPAFLDFDKIEKAIEELNDKIKENKEKWKRIMEDDDIPF